MKLLFIPNEIFHIKKSALRLGALNINTITTGPFPLVHPCGSSKTPEWRSIFPHTDKWVSAVSPAHHNRRPETLILCSKVLAHKHSHVLFVKDIKTSVYPALSAGKQRNGCEATTYVRPHTTMDKSLLDKH